MMYDSWSIFPPSYHNYITLGQSVNKCMVPKHAKYVGQRTRFTCITGALVALQNGAHPQEKTFAPFLPKSEYLRLTTAYETMGWSMNSASITTPLGISRLVIPLAMQHPLFLVELVLLNHNHAIWNLKRTN